jgi:hypothetical protein
MTSRRLLLQRAFMALAAAAVTLLGAVAIARP